MTMQATTARTYLLGLVGAALALGVALAGFVWAVDPYLLGGRPRLAGFNAVKPAVGGYAEAAKTKLALARQPKLLLVGNSRVGIGFDPDTLPPQAPRTANLGVPGASAGTLALRAIAVAQAAPVEHIIIGLDYIDYARVILDRGGEDTTAWAGLVREVRDWSATRVSLSALEDSVRTVMAQRRGATDNMSDSGFDTLGSYDAYYSSIGQYGIFEAYFKKVIPLMARRPQPTPTSDATRVERAALAELAAFAKARGIRLSFIIYPLHTDVLTGMAMANHWTSYLGWQQDMATFIAALNAEHGTDWALWDATAFDGPSAEPVPDARDRSTRMRWWIESGHFRAELGNALTAQILGLRSDGPAVRITDPAAHAATLNTEANRYWASNPDQIDRLKGWLAP
jgi:hypothetical protein